MREQVPTYESHPQEQASHNRQRKANQCRRDRACASIVWTIRRLDHSGFSPKAEGVDDSNHYSPECGEGDYQDSRACKWVNPARKKCDGDSEGQSAENSIG